ncbi:MAG: MotE family protein [Thermodesulfobacteriota bacterium]
MMSGGQVFGGAEKEEKAEAQAPRVVFECEDIGVEARRILDELKARRKQFDERQETLAERENELKVLEQAVEKKLERLKRLRNHLEELLAEKDTAEDERVSKLSKIYQKREPAPAAMNLAAMDNDLAVAILAKMRDRYAGEILDNMENKTAVLYSTMLGQLDQKPDNKQNL